MPVIDEAHAAALRRVGPCSLLRSGLLSLDAAAILVLRLLLVDRALIVLFLARPSEGVGDREINAGSVRGIPVVLL